MILLGTFALLNSTHAASDPKKVEISIVSKWKVNDQVKILMDPNYRSPTWHAGVITRVYEDGAYRVMFPNLQGTPDSTFLDESRLHPINVKAEDFVDSIPLSKDKCLSYNMQGHYNIVCHSEEPQAIAMAKSRVRYHKALQAKVDETGNLLQTYREEQFSDRTVSLQHFWAVSQLNQFYQNLIGNDDFEVTLKDDPRKRIDRWRKDYHSELSKNKVTRYDAQVGAHTIVRVYSVDVDPLWEKIYELGREWWLLDCSYESAFNFSYKKSLKRFLRACCSQMVRNKDPESDKAKKELFAAADRYTTAMNFMGFERPKYPKGYHNGPHSPKRPSGEQTE